MKQQRIRRIGEHAPDNGEADGKATPFFYSGKVCPTVAAFRARRPFEYSVPVNWGYGSELLLVPCDCAQFGKNLRQDITPSVLPRLRAKLMPTGRAHL